MLRNMVFFVSIFQTNSNVIIGAVYLLPNVDIAIFNLNVENMLNTIQKEKKLCMSFC